ncbi:MAG: rod-binding protein [Planctomycetaceae bacterium]|jgi:Rod binding domain-containing protein|nr:rod-binding protein [Planctomycetaceae bacterium]
MLNSITNYSTAAADYAAQQHNTPAVPTALKQQETTDVYERADGTTATRPAIKNGTSSAANEPEPEQDDNESKFRELLHQFIGQTLFGQMLKSMRATQEKNPYFDGGRAEEIFQGQLDQVLTDKMTKATSRSLSEPMYKLMQANMRG